MATTIETDLKEIFVKFDQRFDRLEQRLDRIDSDLTVLKVSQAEIRGDIANLKTELTLTREDVKDLKGRASAQIWALIVAIIGAIAAAAVKFGFFPNP